MTRKNIPLGSVHPKTPICQFTITTGHIDKIKDAKTKNTPLELYKITNNDKIQ